jgi:NitT/TauT family transport system substrate-binding protein
MAICGRITKQPAERYAWVFTTQDNYRDRDMIPDLSALQRNIDLMRDLGFVTDSLDVRKYADLSIALEAAARLE